MPTRRRLTELQRETSRRTTAIALALGHEVAVGRRRIRMTQQGLAARVGISQSAVSRIERGGGRGTPLETWIALGIALGRPVAMSFSRSLDQPRGPADAGHLQIQEHVLALARASGRHGTFELPTRPSDPNRSTDVGLRDDRHQALIQAECWNTFGDLGAAVRSTHRKTVEAETIRPGYRAATVWVVRATAANRDLLARYPNIIAAAFPGSSRTWVRTLTEGIAPPTEPGLVWFDASRGCLVEWRRTPSRPRP